LVGKSEGKRFTESAKFDVDKATDMK
jgi:hypothetical protein